MHTATELYGARFLEKNLKSPKHTDTQKMAPMTAFNKYF